MPRKPKSPKYVWTLSECKNAYAFCDARDPDVRVLDVYADKRKPPVFDAYEWPLTAREAALAVLTWRRQ